MNYKFAFVGCGTIAAKHIQAINLIENAEITAFYDIVPDKAKALSDKVPGSRYYSNLGKMMEESGDRIDIISVLTPSGIHYSNVMELLQYEKPLIVEKPITLRLDEADGIIDECAKKGVKIFVVHQNRYNRPIIKAREALEQGRFGKLVLGTVRLRWKRDQAYYDSAKWRGTWSHDGGVMTNQASHHIDMLTWFMGNVKSVNAVASTRLVNIECEDTGIAVLKFTSGALGLVEATTATRPRDLEGSISILGEKGSVVIGGFFMNELVTWNFEDHLPIDDVIREEWGKNPETWGYNLSEYLRDVMNSLDLNKAGLVDGAEARKSLELISAIYESVETGKEVPLRFQPKRCRLGLT